MPLPILPLFALGEKSLLNFWEARNPAQEKKYNNKTLGLQKGDKRIGEFMTLGPWGTTGTKTVLGRKGSSKQKTKSIKTKGGRSAKPVLLKQNEVEERRGAFTIS